MDAIVKVEGRELKFLDVDPNSHIGNCLLNVCLYELPNLEIIKALNVKGNYVDVGAHIGTHALYFSLFCPSWKVYAFEPHRDSYEKLVANLTVNHAENCIPFPVALAEEKDAELPIDQGEIWTRRTLDSFDLWDVKVLKIDVESSELRVLQGAKETLKSVEHLFLEVWTDEVYARRGEKSPMADIVAFLKPYGIEPVGAMPWEDLWHFKKNV